jgi:ATP/maltotriose-dependent transcriptional regulator MalT
MDDTEAKSVLRRADGKAEQLILRAQGWPAVLGLASLAGAVHLPANELPPALYDYFAEELYQGLSEITQVGLTRLAVLSGLPIELLLKILGASAEEMLEEAARVGAIVSATSEIEVHPLLQEFLLTKLEVVLRRDDDGFARKTVEVLTADRRWDAAFNLITRVHAPGLLPEILEAALDDLLREGRVQTISRWLEFSYSTHLSSPVLDLSEAEIAFRQGQYARAEGLALQASEALPSRALRARALIRSGQSAMLDSRDASALESFRKARRLADEPDAQREALVGECLAILELGLAAETQEPFIELDQVVPSSVDQHVRQVAVRMVRAVKFGGINKAIRLAAEASPLIKDVSDPLIETAFLCTRAHLLILASRYLEAVIACQQALDVADQYRLAFVRPHALTASALAHTGLREFATAATQIDEAEESAGSHDLHIAMCAATSRARIAIAQQNFDASLEFVSRNWERPGSAAMRAEQLAYRALTLALLAQAEECKREVDEIRSLPGATVEAQVLAAGAKVVCSTLSGSGNDDVRLFVEAVATTGLADSLVTVVRGSPPVLEAVADVCTDIDWLREVLRQSNDFKLARTAHLELARPLSRDRAGLTARELEVARLLARGDRNREIGDKLFISEATVKVHVRHIREKVGGSSRTELAARIRDLLD